MLGVPALRAAVMSSARQELREKSIKELMKVN
jgi:hypothetical protein